MSTSKVTLPDIPSYVAKAFPIRIQANPHHREVESESYEWFDKYGIYTEDKREQFLSPEFGLMTALLCPTVDASALRIMMDFTLWFFCFKSMVDKNEFDSLEKLKAASDALMRVANDASAPNATYKPAAMLQSCFQRIRQDGSPVVVQRLVAGVDEYTEACFQERFNLSTTPTLEEYIELRRGTCGTKLWSTMLQYVIGVDLPDEVVDHPSVSGLTITAHDVLNLAQEIYSSILLRGEGRPLNIVSMAMYHNKDLDLNGSIQLVDRVIKKRLDEYMDIKADLPSFGPGMDEQVAEYIQAIENSIHGFVEWAFMTPIYFGYQRKSARETGVVDLDMLIPA